MKYDHKTVTEYDLHKFVDGELSDAETRAIAGSLAKDEAHRQMVDEFREINLKLHETFDENQSTPIPARLLFAVSGRRRLSMWSVAASFLWLCIGGVLGYSLQNQFATNDYLRPLPVEAAYAHAVYVPEIRHPVEVNASEQDHLNAWLSKRLDQPISAPDLRILGYSLIGGRLLPDGHRAAAQFMYEGSDGKRITLYIRQALNTRETAFLHAQDNELGIIYWVDGGLAYALTAATDKAELTKTATEVYQQANL